MKERPPSWTVKEITTDDLVDIVSAGIRDFRAAPKYGLFFGAVYVAAGWLLIALLVKFGMPYLAYPLAMGFALIAPFAVIGLYAVSDNLERGQPNSWPAIFQVLKSALGRDVRWMALVTGFALVIWMDIAAFLIFAFVGVNGFGPGFFDTILTTPSGLLFLALGNLAGAIIAFGVFSISAISFPMLYDQDIDFVTAMTTSVRLVKTNPKAMLAWCATIGILLAISIASAFVGLLVILPVIGHATWHLYRRAIAPAHEVVAATA